jgi:thiosulfate/3-mercaptopyruvate sulfurtransferase
LRPSLAIGIAAGMNAFLPFITPADLATLPTSSVCVIDIRPREAFAAGHVPGAVSSPYTMGWRAREGAAPGMLPSTEALETLIGATGLTPDKRAVIVASGATASDLAGAARVYWTLKTAGHAAVSILAGGFEAEVSQGFPLSTGNTTSVSSSRYPVRFSDAHRSDLAATMRVLEHGDHFLIDAREPAQYAGTAMSPDRTAPRTGLI